MADSADSALTDLGKRAVQLADKGDGSSIALFGELVRRLQQLPDTPGRSLSLAQALFYGGRAYSSVPSVLDLDKAAADLERERRLFALFSDSGHEAESLGQLGVVEARRYERAVRDSGPQRRASEAYRNADRLWQASFGLTGDLNVLATNRSNLARLYLTGGESKAAANAYSRLLPDCEAGGDARGALQASHGLALSLAALGQRRQARRVARATLRRSAALGPDGARIGRAVAQLVQQLS